MSLCYCQAFKRLLFFVFTTAALSLFAQKKGATPNRLDEQYVPGNNSIFNSEGASSDGNNRSSNDDMEINYTMKANPLMAFRGVFPLYYERFLTDYLSLQAGLGICFNKDIVMVTASNVFSVEDAKSSISISEMITTFDYSGDKTLYFSLTGRFYIDTYSDQGTYMELGVRYQQFDLLYKKEVSPQDKFSQIQGTRVDVTTVNFPFIWGYQKYFGNNFKSVHDFYVGLGIKNISYDAFKYEKITIPSTQNTSGKIEIDVHTKTSRESLLVPAFLMGYSLGFGK